MPTFRKGQKFETQCSVACYMNYQNLKLLSLKTLENVGWIVNQQSPSNACASSQDFWEVRSQALLISLCLAYELKQKTEVWASLNIGTLVFLISSIFQSSLVSGPSCPNKAEYSN